MHSLKKTGHFLLDLIQFSIKNRLFFRFVHSTDITAVAVKTDDPA